MKLPDIHTPSGAIFCGKEQEYRPVLWRYWGPGHAFLMICGLNPSTADHTVNDPTIRREIDFATRFGYDGLLKVNAFDLRATDPKVMMAHPAPNSAENDGYIYACAMICAGPPVAAWGVHGVHNNRHRELRDAYEWRCFGKTKDGHPKHPLYLPKTTILVPFNTCRESHDADAHNDRNYLKIC